MKSTEFYALAEQFAPKSLSDEFCRRYGAYDNSGLLLDSGEEAEKILFSLDLSLAAIERAVAGWPVQRQRDDVRGRKILIAQPAERDGFHDASSRLTEIYNKNESRVHYSTRLGGVQ